MVARRVSNGRYQDFHHWLGEGRDLAADFPGYLGSGVLAPPPGDDEYQIIFRFRDTKTLATWEHSASRRTWLERGAGLYEAPHEHRAIGLDGWFQDATGSTPPRWKQGVAIWCAFFPVSLLFNWLFGPLLTDVALVPRMLVTTLALTPMMVFVFIPISMRLLGPWLRGEFAPLARLSRRLHQGSA
jgi:antibiotic biosynthesis monooxygenase (ABM) superfamily enzyme